MSSKAILFLSLSLVGASTHMTRNREMFSKFVQPKIAEYVFYIFSCMVNDFNDLLPV
jgi:hypothetical protein